MGGKGLIINSITRLVVGNRRMDPRTDPFETFSDTEFSKPMCPPKNTASVCCKSDFVQDRSQETSHVNGQPLY